MMKIERKKSIFAWSPSHKISFCHSWKIIIWLCMRSTFSSTLQNVPIQIYECSILNDDVLSTQTLFSNAFPNAAVAFTSFEKKCKSETLYYPTTNSVLKKCPPQNVAQSCSGTHLQRGQPVAAAEKTLKSWKNSLRLKNQGDIMDFDRCHIVEQK